MDSFYSEAWMRAAQNRWTILVVGVTMTVTLGCRGSKPFGRFVQVTKESQHDDIQVDTPNQRLATAKPRVETEVTVTTQVDGSPYNDRYINSRPVDPSTTASKTTAPTYVERTSSSISDLPTEAADKLQLPRSPAVDRVAATRKRASERPEVRQVADLSSTITDLPAKPQPSSTSVSSRTEPKTKSSSRTTPMNNESVAPEHSELLAAFSDYPPEVQREALRRLVAATSRSAEKTTQPSSLDSVLTRNLQYLPELPASNPNRGDEAPVRLASNEQRDSHRRDVAESTRRPNADSIRKEKTPVRTESQAAIASLTDEPSGRVTDLDVAELEPVVVQSISDASDDIKSPVQPASASRSIGDDSMVARAAVVGEVDEDTQSLYESLLAQLAKAPAGETESARASRMIKLRHLMVLSGNLDAAVEQIEGMPEAEQEFLRHQLLGLWTMVDPDGHPVPSRRITTALPQLREAAKFAAAATDSLELRSLAFCTEIESYGQIKTFSGNRFSAGQQVILYCEIENFTANKNADGYETHLQGSYDVYNAKNERIVSQVLPADKQVSANYLRDYFIAYQMNLPAQLDPGTYRLQMTMEDVHGKKYGQSSIPFEVAK
ncbi:hypothetical protein [Rubripirellula tenax]|nr:hypothetical protein [Rubripirellula tenax]